MQNAEIESLPIGTKVRVVLEGTVEEFVMKPRSPGWDRYPVTRAPRRMVKVADEVGPWGERGIFLSPAQIRAAESVEQISPSWQPGDVISVAFADGSYAPRYTYVRGAAKWVGENTNGLTDRDVARRFSEGKVTHLVRDGKPVLPF